MINARTLSRKEMRGGEGGREGGREGGVAISPKEIGGGRREGRSGCLILLWLTLCIQSTDRNEVALDYSAGK